MHQVLFLVSFLFYFFKGMVSLCFMYMCLWVWVFIYVCRCSCVKVAAHLCVCVFRGQLGVWFLWSHLPCVSNGLSLMWSLPSRWARLVSTCFHLLCSGILSVEQPDWLFFMSAGIEALMLAQWTRYWLGSVASTPCVFEASLEHSTYVSVSQTLGLQVCATKLDI